MQLQLTHVIKQHSELPKLSLTLTDAESNPVDLTDATSVTFVMHLLGDATTSVVGAATVVEPEAGQVEYAFTAANTQISGKYLATMKATFPSSQDRIFPYNGYYLIDIQPDLVEDASDADITLTFATVADASAMGYQLTAEELRRAEGHIEASCGRTIEELAEVDLSVPDAARLKKATVYQAEWLRANADTESRMDITLLRTAGLSGESAELTTDGIVLAPLARRLITRLSWVRSRSINVRPQTNKGVHPNSLDGDIISWKSLGW